MEFYDFHDFHNSQQEFYAFHDFNDSPLKFSNFRDFHNSHWISKTYMILVFFSNEPILFS